MSSDNPSAWQHRVSVGDVTNEAVVTNTTPDPAAYGLAVRTIGGGGGPVTIADGADVAEGATTDAAVTTDAAGTVSSKLRGLVKILGDVWDSVNHLLRVSIQNASIAVTGSLGRTWTLGSATDSVTAVQSTAANLNATVTGSISVSNFPATQPVSGSVSVSNFPSPQTVAGSNTPADNIANPTNTIPAESFLMAWDSTNSVWRRVQVDAATGTLKVDSSGFTQPISGSVTATQSSGSNLHVNVDSAPTTTVTGTVTSNQGSPNSTANSWPVEVTDGTNVLGVAAHPVRVDPTGTTTQPISGSISVSNFPSPQIVAGSNTPADNVTNPTNAVPAEALLMGWDSTNSVWRRVQVDTSTGTLKVDGSGYTQPVSGTVTANQGGSPWQVQSNSANIATSAQLPTALDGSGFLKVHEQGTATVSGTVTSNQGGAPWTQRIQDGTTSTLAVVTAANALKVDGSAVTQPVSGTVTANAGTGNFTVVQTTGSNLHVDVDNFSTTYPAQFYTRSDTYTTTGTGTTINMTAAPCSQFTIEVKGTGAAATSWTAILEISLDGTNFTTVASHTKTTGDGISLNGSYTIAALYFRSRVSTLSLGSATNIVVTILGIA